MSFAEAAFLAGLVAMGLPWWLHWRDSLSRQPQTVSSLLLMRPSETPRQARKTLRHRWLLALRLLLLALLALAFAQPLLERTFAEQPAGAVALPRIITLDTSLSMRVDFPAAQRLAHRIIDELPPGGRAAVVGVADDVTVAAPLSGERALLHGAVDALRPGMARLAFDGLVGRLTGLAGTLVDGAVEVHLISDFQRSAMPAQFNGLVAGALGLVVLHPVTPDRRNWHIEQLSVGDDVGVTVRGIDTPERQLEVVLAGSRGELGRRALTVPPGGRATARFPLPEAGRGDVWLQASLEAGDVLAADDTIFHVLRHSQPVALPLFASPGAAAQLDYLSAAVAAAAPRFRPAAAEQPGPVAVLVDAGELTAERVRLLERHLHNGGAVLMTVGPATRRAGRLPLSGQALEPARLDDQPRGVVAADRSHPALAHFSAWRDVTVSRRLGAASAGSASMGSVLLTLDDGSPLLLEQRLGAGRLLVLMTALDPDWSTLVTRPAFVDFVADALGYLAEDVLPAATVAGQRLIVPAANVQLFDRSGNRMLSLGETVGRPSVALHEPGIYTLRTPSQERLLAVNPDLRESDLAAAEPALLQRWQSATRVLDAQQPATAGLDGPVSTLPLAPWLLAMLAVLAVLEPLAANSARVRERATS